jgi:hypothetical protein
LVVVLAALGVACSGGEDELVASDVVSAIPWTAPETARYRLLQGDDVKGSAELQIEEDGDSLALKQYFDIPDEM